MAKTNLVHSKAARKPLVSITLNILRINNQKFSISYIMTMSDGEVRRPKGGGGGAGSAPKSIIIIIIMFV